jgi:Ca2+-binding EF-hand superfamily protein
MQSEESDEVEYRWQLQHSPVPCGAATIATPSAAAPADILRTLDPDRDGTVDLNEAKAAASALFDRLDRDRDGTLDRRELRGRLSAKELAAADPDHDGTLTKAEYLAVVDKRFTAAIEQGRYA